MIPVVFWGGTYIPKLHPIHSISVKHCEASSMVSCVLACGFYPVEIQHRYQKWWIFFECICISFRIWLFWVSTLVSGVVHLHHGVSLRKAVSQQLIAAPRLGNPPKDDPCSSWVHYRVGGWNRLKNYESNWVHLPPRIEVNETTSYVWNPFPNKKGLGLPRVSGIYTLQWTKSTSSLIHRSIGIYLSFLPGVFDPFWDIFQGDPGAQVRTKTLGPPTWRKIRRSCDRCSGTTFAWLSQTSWRQRQKEVTRILCFMKKTVDYACTV